MDIEKEMTGNQLLVKASGRIDASTAAEYGSSITDSIEDDNIKHLTLDFSNINYISSLGLRIILELQKKMNTLGSMKVIHVQPDVMEVFNITGFSKILVIE